MSDDEWTQDRAYRLLRNSNIRVVLLLSQLVQGDGWLDAHAYREKWGTTPSVARRPP